MLSAVAILLSAFTLHLAPHGAHGVPGAVTLSRVSASTTRVAVTLRVHDTRARPVHIHGGSCGTFFGLPFGMWTMHGARGSSVVRASMAELLSGRYAIDVHASPTSAAWIACANLRR